MPLVDACLDRSAEFRNRDSASPSRFFIACRPFGCWWPHRLGRDQRSDSPIDIRTIEQSADPGIEWAEHCCLRQVDVPRMPIPSRRTGHHAARGTPVVDASLPRHSLHPPGAILAPDPMAQRTLFYCRLAGEVRDAATIAQATSSRRGCRVRTRRRWPACRRGASSSARAALQLSCRCS